MANNTLESQLSKEWTAIEDGNLIIFLDGRFRDNGRRPY